MINFDEMSLAQIEFVHRVCINYPALVAIELGVNVEGINRLATYLFGKLLFAYMPNTSEDVFFSMQDRYDALPEQLKWKRNG